MDKVKMTKKEFDELYEVVDLPKAYANKDEFATDTSETIYEKQDKIIQDKYKKEETVLTEEEEAQDKELEETLGWDIEE